MKATRKRTRAREISVQTLYQYDACCRISGGSADQAAGEARQFIDTEAGDPEVREFALQLVTGTCETLDEIDALLAQVVVHWRLSRIAAMDRAILRLAVFELHWHDQVPPKVAINEAIDLAKKFSTSNSGSFVNGILDRLLQLKTEKKTDESSDASGG